MYSRYTFMRLNVPKLLEIYFSVSITTSFGFEISSNTWNILVCLDYVRDIFLCIPCIFKTSGHVLWRSWGIGFTGYAVKGPCCMMSLAECSTWFGEILKGVFMTKFHLKICGANRTVILSLVQLTRGLSPWNYAFRSSRKVSLLSVRNKIRSLFGFSC